MTKMRIKRVIISALLCLVLSLGMFTPFLIPASAAGGLLRQYSNVLDDLEKDENFNPVDFPENPTDYSLQVITVAEGDNGELFVYVYQPSNATKDLRASKINMSFQEPTEKDIKYSLHDLIWLNSNGVFDKYLVSGVNVSTEQYRYYNIASLYRIFDSSIDENPVSVDGTNFKSCSCGKVFSTHYYNGNLIYESGTVEVLEIDILSSGTIRYHEGFKLYYDACDSHYVAFKIQGYEVSQIYDADITYTYRDVSQYFSASTGFEYEYGEYVTIPSRYLSSIEIGSNDGDGFFGKTYSWNRIQTVDSFLNEAENDANESFSIEERSALSNCDFVFRFFETDLTVNNYGISTSTEYTEVASIGILRLHFLTRDLKEYNLGVVGDLVFTDNNPDLEVDILDNVQNTVEEALGALKIIMGIVIFIIIYLLFKPLIDFVFSIILWAIKGAFSIVWWFLTLPFCFFSWLFRR